MTRPETVVLRAHRDARKVALSAVVAEARRVLPKGWTIHLAVGWGLAVHDEKGETVMSNYVDLPARLPRGVRDLLKATASLYDLFGPENDKITNKGVAYPRARRM